MSQPKLTPTVNDQLATGGSAGAGSNDPIQFVSPVGDPLRPRKVAIVGTQPSSRFIAPYQDPSWTIWGTSPGNMKVIPRVDAWFEMHANFLWPQYKAAYGEAYVQWLNEQKFPLVAGPGKETGLFPRALPYPLVEMIRRFGPYFFTSTFSYCMAYAIHVGVEELALYGVDMSSRGEYITQRPGGHYFIQRAQEAGIKVSIPQESDLSMPPPLYGYSDASDYGRKQATRRFEVAERVSQLEQQVQQGSQQLAYLKGAAEDIQYNEDIYASVEQFAVIKAMLQGQYHSREREMPVVQAPPLGEGIQMTMAEPLAGLDLPGVVSNMGIGDAMDLRPRVPGKRKGRDGKKR